MTGVTIFILPRKISGLRVGEACPKSQGEGRGLSSRLFPADALLLFAPCLLSSQAVNIPGLYPGPLEHLSIPFYKILLSFSDGGLSLFYVSLCNPGGWFHFSEPLFPQLSSGTVMPPSHRDAMRIRMT